MFDEYFQVGNPQRDRAKGLGLGLAIAKRLSNVLGCGIRCHSRVNKGSTFEISVPLADAPEALAVFEPVPIAIDKASSPCNAALHIMIIEDDPMAAKALELSLTAQGMTVDIHASAEQALADARCEQADFYFVDYRLPGMSGMQFLHTVQSRVKRPLKAALLTGETSLESLDNAASRSWKVIMKPVESAALIAEIEAQCVSEIVE